jgi:hypothetical protein
VLGWADYRPPSRDTTQYPREFLDSIRLLQKFEPMPTFFR